MATARKPTAPFFERLKVAARSEANRASLFRWFLAHHDAFAAVLADVARPSWDAITEELTAEGLTKRNGLPITPAYARQAWWRADRAYAARKPADAKRRQPTAPPPVPAPSPSVAPPAVPLRPAFDPTDGEPDPAPKPRFKPATFKR